MWTYRILDDTDFAYDSLTPVYGVYHCCVLMLRTKDRAFARDMCERENAA